MLKRISRSNWTGGKEYRVMDLTYLTVGKVDRYYDLTGLGWHASVAGYVGFGVA